MRMGKMSLSVNYIIRVWIKSTIKSRSRNVLLRINIKKAYSI